MVGNNHYDQVKPDLDNAVNDAKGIYEAFMNLGFMMMPEAYDIGFEKFDKLFDSFKSDLGNYEVGVLYFSGHGIEIYGKNYLIMCDTPIGDLAKSTIRFAVDLQECISELHATGCKMIIVIIDACRNNPFEGKEKGWGSVNLAPIFAPKGTLIAYSTSPGETANDFGMYGHSVYTGALLKHLKEEGLEIETFFKKVRSTVDAMTGGKKTSWEHTSLIGSFSFNSGKMIHVDDIGYDANVISDGHYFSVNDKVMSPIIKKMKSYNWYDQNEGVESFLKIHPKELNKNQLFVMGRNLLQSAIGGSYDAKDLIIDGDILKRYCYQGDNHLLNGILFEIYFNHEGKFRYKNFKTRYLNEIMQFALEEELKNSFSFIRDILKGFAQFLIFVPSPDPTIVTINVKLNKENVEGLFGDPMEVSVVKSVSFDGHELLADEEDSNVFPFSMEHDIRKDAFENLICEGYGIPSAFLNVIYNETPLKENDVLWLDRKLRRSFRNGMGGVDLPNSGSTAE